MRFFGPGIVGLQEVRDASAGVRLATDARVVRRTDARGAAVRYVRAVNWRQRHLERLRSFNPLAVDSVLAVIFTVVGIATAFGQDISDDEGFREPTALLVLTAVVICAPIAMRRRWPLMALMVSSIGIVVHFLVGWPEGSLPLATLLLTYTVGTRCPLRRAVVGLAVPCATIVMLAVAGPRNLMRSARSASSPSSPPRGRSGSPSVTAGRRAMRASREAVVQPRRPPLGDRPDLRAGRPQRVRGLLRVAALHPPATARAVPDGDIEAGHHHRRTFGQIDLPLLGDPVEHHRPTTVRAAPRQRRLEGAVRVAERPAVPVTAMTLATLAARPTRRLCRISLGERGGLPLPRAPRLFQQLLQLGDPGVTCRQLLFQPGKPGFQLGDPCLLAHPHHSSRNTRDWVDPAIYIRSPFVARRRVPPRRQRFRHRGLHGQRSHFA